MSSNLTPDIHVRVLHSAPDEALDELTEVLSRFSTNVHVTTDRYPLQMSVEFDLPTYVGVWLTLEIAKGFLAELGKPAAVSMINKLSSIHKRLRGERIQWVNASQARALAAAVESGQSTPSIGPSGSPLSIHLDVGVIGGTTYRREYQFPQELTEAHMQRAFAEVSTHAQAPFRTIGVTCERYHYFPNAGGWCRTGPLTYFDGAVEIDPFLQHTNPEYTHAGPLIGNREKMIFRWCECRKYVPGGISKKQILLYTLDMARALGYRPAKDCPSSPLVRLQ